MLFKNLINMSSTRLFILLLLAFFVSSCSSKKDILYLQGTDKYISSEINYKNHIIKIDDILRVKVITIDSDAANQFNLGSDVMGGNNKELMKLNGYIVDNEGNINFPIIGKVMLAGKTINQARSIIYNLILDSGYLKNHTVDVKLLNAHFTVLGEVNKPGTFEYIENNMNILKAIGYAGDLTITAKRNEIKLIREINNKNEIFDIDISKSDLIHSDFFQIYSGDIIIVEPNSTRIKNAGIIGNSGTLISLLSFLLSSIIIINGFN